MLIGDARQVLSTLPGSYADCCVTSPPYWLDINPAYHHIAQQRLADQTREARS